MKLKKKTRTNKYIPNIILHKISRYTSFQIEVSRYTLVLFYHCYQICFTLQIDEQNILYKMSKIGKAELEINLITEKIKLHE